LLCRPNSHPFNDRTLVLDQEVKVGRSVARAKPTITNAIFDCKVLSRNHATLWYSLGKFYLQDTKSSNGTFVNNQRLSKGAEESAPREVCSGDILQFGVDVMENSRKVTHGCIIATLKLFLPDGKEAKASPSIVNTSSSSSIPTQDLYQLNTFIQESLAREQLLENKLIALQNIIAETEMASKSGWQALMDEDRLLTRLEILENQLGTYAKSMGEDKLREETKRLMDDKESYQIAAKENLKKLVDDKLEAFNKLKETETSLSNLEDEFASMRGLYSNVLEENKKLTEKIAGLADQLNSKQQKEEDEEEDDEEEEGENKKELYIENAALSNLLENGEQLLNGSLDTREEEEINLTDRMISSTDSLDGSKPESDSCDVKLEVSGGKKDLANDLQLTSNNLNEVNMNEVNRLRGLVEDLSRARDKNEDEIRRTRDALDEARHDSSVVLQELNNTKNKLEDAERLIETQDSLVREMETRVQENTISSAPESEGDQQLPPFPAAPGGADFPLGDLDTLDPRNSSRALVELHLKVSELEEENLLLKQKLKETELENEKIQKTSAVEPTAATSSPVETLNAAIQDSTLDARTSKISAESTSKSTPTVGADHSQASATETHNGEDSTASTSNSSTTQQQSLGSRTVDLGEPLASSNSERMERADLNLSTASSLGLNESALSCSSCSDLSSVERALVEAEEKIAKLLKVKESLVAIQTEKSMLEGEVSCLEEDIEALAVTSRFLTLCNIAPVLVILVAIVIAFLPTISAILGTKEAL